jgi:hypothetical protein
MPVQAISATGPSVHASAVTDQKAPAARYTSPPVAADAGELVLAYIAAGGSSRNAQQVTAVTGGGLVWSLVARSNADGSGTTEVWQARASLTVPKLVVTAALLRGPYAGMIQVVSYTGAEIGAVARATGRRDSPVVTVAPTRAGSLIWSVGRDIGWHESSLTVPPTETFVHAFRDRRSNQAAWTVRLLAATASTLPVTIRVDGPRRDVWQSLGVEVRSRQLPAGSAVVAGSASVAPGSSTATLSNPLVGGSQAPTAALAVALLGGVALVPLARGRHEGPVSRRRRRKRGLPSGAHARV